MPRVKKAPASRNRRRRVLKKAKGFFIGRRTLYRAAAETVMRGMVYATRDRKQRKRQFRRLWTVRINAACRLNGTTYSKLIAGFKAAKVAVDRKMLAELAIHDPEVFAQLAALASGSRKS